MKGRNSFPISVLCRNRSYKAILCISTRKEEDSKTLLAYGLRQIFPEMPEILVKRGFFGDPLLIPEKEITCQASVSHSAGTTATIVSNSLIPIGLDIEKIKPRDYKCYFTAAEKNQIGKLRDVISQPALETLLWAAKESLSKAIRLGFTVDVSIYAVKSIIILEDTVFFRFLHFPRFQCQGKIIKNHFALAITYPQEADLVLEDEIVIQPAENSKNTILK